MVLAVTDPVLLRGTDCGARFVLFCFSFESKYFIECMYGACEVWAKPSLVLGSAAPRTVAFVAGCTSCRPGLQIVCACVPYTTNTFPHILLFGS